MFGKLFGKKNKTARSIASLDDVMPGDMLSFKDRPDMPQQIRGQTVKVTSIGSYQYESESAVEMVLETPDGGTVSLSYASVDEGTMTLAIKVPESSVVKIFDEAEFSQLWGEDFPVLKAKSEESPLSDWICSEYKQTAKEGTAYYFNSDRRGKADSQYEDDGSEELRYHEASGGTECYSLNVEIWSSGETDVFLCRTFNISTIEEYWVGEKT